MQNGKEPLSTEKNFHTCSIVHLPVSLMQCFHFCVSVVVMPSTRRRQDVQRYLLIKPKSKLIALDQRDYFSKDEQNNTTENKTLKLHNKEVTLIYRYFHRYSKISLIN